MARNFIATHQIMCHSSYLVYPRVPLPHQLLLHLHRRKFQKQVEVKRWARTHQHEETRRMNQQKPKTQMKWRRRRIARFARLAAGSVPKHRDASSSSHELPLEPSTKVVPSKHSIFTHFPKDRNCDICLRTKITRASCRRRTGTVVPRAENFGDSITADHKVLSEGCESRHNHRSAVVVQDLLRGQYAELRKGHL